VGESSVEASSKHVEGGGATSHISTIESSDEASWREGGGAMRRRLEFSTCWREPPVAISGLLLRELQMLLANYD
jgi:hypothetical protein